MDKWTSEDIREINHRFKKTDPLEILRWVNKELGPEAVMGTGFGPSGIMLLHIISRYDLHIPVFYLDTDLLFDETYTLRDELESFFNIKFKKVHTELSVEEQNIQYDSELWEKNPNKCCYLRKVLPLKNYLKDKKAWITGVRRSQSDTRSHTLFIQRDPFNNVWKVNPLANWTSEEVWSYIHLNELPYNELHDRGYPSIGCRPCTLPVKPGEHERAGRWAGLDKTECGIHLPTQPKSD